MTAAASSKPKAGKPVTTRILAAALAEQHQLSKKQGLEMLEDLIGMITKHLKKGERVKIAGLGILLVRNRAARMGRTPMTGEAIKIKASKKVAFRAAKDLNLASSKTCKAPPLAGGVFICHNGQLPGLEQSHPLRRCRRRVCGLHCTAAENR